MKVISAFKAEQADINMAKSEEVLAAAQKRIERIVLSDISEDAINPLAHDLRIALKELRTARLHLKTTSLFKTKQEEELAIQRLLSEYLTLASCSKMFTATYFQDIEDISFIKNLCMSLVDLYGEEKTCPSIWKALVDAPDMFITKSE